MSASVSASASGASGPMRVQGPLVTSRTIFEGAVESVSNDGTFYVRAEFNEAPIPVKLYGVRRLRTFSEDDILHLLLNLSPSHR